MRLGERDRRRRLRVGKQKGNELLVPEGKVLYSTYICLTHLIKVALKHFSVSTNYFIVKSKAGSSHAMSLYLKAGMDLVSYNNSTRPMSH
jgi:hypothetical protein